VNISSVTPQLPNHGVKYVSELTSFNVDPALIRGKVTDAKLELDYSTRTATLQIGSNPCPVVHGYVACSAIRAERVIEVSIVSRVDVGCGSQKITALHDGRPADGQLEILEIVDHTARVCMDLRPHAVEVTLTTESAGMGGPIVRTRSTFGGELFQR
jgi:hypothetical protein